MRSRDSFEVTCKVAFFNSDKSKVVLAEYGPAQYGLPGGHLNKDENPEQAMRREVFEEAGYSFEGELRRSDFWFHPSGKLILAFLATLDEGAILTAADDVSNLTWVKVSDIKDGNITAGTYDEFILKSSM